MYELLSSLPSKMEAGSSSCLLAQSISSLSVMALRVNLLSVFGVCIHRLYDKTREGRTVFISKLTGE